MTGRKAESRQRPSPPPEFVSGRPRIGPLAAAAVALLFVCAGPTGCGGPEGRKASHMARGQRYLAEGNLDKARVEFANALQISPNDPDARYLNGRVAEQLGDPRAAATLYQGAIDLNAGHVGARAHLARLYVFAGRADRALEVVEPALASHPDDPELLTARAAARAMLRDEAGAQADAERAVQLTPLSEDSVSALAALYVKRGQAQRAIELLRDTLRRAPASIELRQLLARVYVTSGDSQLAEAQLRELMKMRPRELRPRLQLASFYVTAKRVDDAEGTLKAATAQLPGSREAKLAYADFLATQRPPAQAEAALRELIVRDSRDYDLQLRLGALQERSGATRDAVATYRSIVAHDPRGPKGVAARDRIAAIDLVSGESAEVRPLLAEALSISPGDTDALTLRGNLLLEAGDPVGAIADLRAALRGQPGAVAILRALARAHLANREPTLAEDNLRSALAAAPHDVGASADLGELLTRTRRAGEAVELLGETVKATPGAAGTAARVALIEAYVAEPDLTAARSAAEELKTLRPDLPAGSYLAGLIAEQRGRPDEAQREFERALRLQPSSIEALAAHARLDVQRGQRAQAVALVRGAIDRSPGSAAAQNLLGEVYLADKDYTAAASALEEAVRLAPKWSPPYRNLAAVRTAMNDPAGALAACEAGVRATQSPQLVIDLAEMYVRRGRIDDAIHQYEILHNRDPRDEVAANNLAMLLVTYRADAASLDRARNLTVAFADSSVAALLDTHGWVLLKRGDLAPALAALQRAAAEAPDSPIIRYHLGMAQLEAGQSDKARESLEAALAGGASFTGTDAARLALAQLKGRTW